MKKFNKLWVAVVCVPWLSCVVHAQQTYYSRPQFVNQSVGLLETQIRDYIYRGSATVARDQRLLYSCAHVVYDSGVWAKVYTFHRAWHDQRYPAKRLGVAPRGFHFLTGYAKAARYTNGESNASFANDFTVFYGAESFGPAARVQESSGPMLRTNRDKRIIGYPSRVDFTGERGYSYQHNTGWFPNRAYQVRDRYHDFFGVSTGPGNSGGGIFLRDPLTGADLLAGILVSGARRSAGVVAMDYNTRWLASQAIGSAQTSWSTANASQISSFESGDTLLRTLPVSVNEAEGSLESLALEVKLSGIVGEAPAVFLQAPSGRIRRIAIPDAQQGIIHIRKHNLGESFRNTVATGRWSVRVRADPAITFERACLRGVSAN